MMTASGDTNLYEHITEVLTRVIQESPDDPVDVFEELSAAVKADRFVPSDAEGKLADQGAASSSTVVASREFAEGVSRLIGSADEPLTASDGVAQDVLDESAVWAWAGVSFTKDEVYALFLSMTRHSSETGAQGLRFWGKVLGIKADYYVLEGVDPEAGESDEANALTYWVSTNIYSEWTRLPNFNGSHVTTARAIRRFFTGDLEAEVSSYPPFEGSEKHHLRTVIALINADCALSPKGVWENDEETGSKKKVEDAPETSVDDLSSIAGWERVAMPFNGEGVIAPQLVEDEPNADRVPMVRAIETEKEFSCRVLPGLAKSNDKALAMIRSNVWSGAVSIGFRSGRSVSIYCGHGLKTAETMYTPPPPPVLQSECESKFAEQADVTEAPAVDDEEKEE